MSRLVFAIVGRGPQRIWLWSRAGCDEIAVVGTRSAVPDTGVNADAELAVRGADGKTDGRAMDKARVCVVSVLLQSFS